MFTQTIWEVGFECGAIWSTNVTDQRGASHLFGGDVLDSQYLTMKHGRSVAVPRKTFAIRDFDLATQTSPTAVLQ